MGPRNTPATPSIALNLAELHTTTTVECLSAGTDEIEINGQPADSVTRQRVSEYLQYWRDQNLLREAVRVTSVNSFASGIGLASSASGYAALAAALGAVASRRLKQTELSRMARIGSGSAARSIPGGLARLPVSSDPAAHRLAPAEGVPWGMVVTIVSEQPKLVSSRKGMELSRQTSPYYTSWVRQARMDYLAMQKALLCWDLTSVGMIAEQNALAMHACMLTTKPPLLYWTPGTVGVIQAVRRWRNEGLQVYFTIDAGPNVILLCRLEEREEVAAAARKLEPVLRAFSCTPGAEAAII